jgi:hypothetical protein
VEKPRALWLVPGQNATKKTGRHLNSKSVPLFCAAQNATQKTERHLGTAARGGRLCCSDDWTNQTQNPRHNEGAHNFSQYSPRPL